MAGTLAECLGQFLLIEVEEGVWSSPLDRLIRKLLPGGIIFSQARPRGADACGAFQALIYSAGGGSVPFLVLEEDGREASLLRNLFPPLPSPRAAARVGVAAVERLGNLVGAGMKSLGFNTNLAPALDLLSPFSESVLGHRVFSRDGSEVARCAEAFVNGLASHGVQACGKHFPGLGGADVQDLPGAPVVGKTMVDLWRADLVPYRQLAESLPLVMLSHCVYKAYDFDILRPAALSPAVVEGLLRVKLGYQGLAIADFRQPSTGLAVDLGEAAAQSVIAGCDLLVTSPEGAEKVLVRLRQALESGRLSTGRVDQSLKRIRVARKRLARPSGKVSKAALDRLARDFENFSRECVAEEQRFA